MKDMELLKDAVSQTEIAGIKCVAKCISLAVADLHCIAVHYYNCSNNQLVGVSLACAADIQLNGLHCITYYVP